MNEEKYRPATFLFLRRWNVDSVVEPFVARFYLEVMAQMRESLRVTQTHAVTIFIGSEKSFDPTVQLVLEFWI